MKKYLFFTCCFCSTFICYAQQGFTLKVKLSNLEGYTPYLFYRGFDGKYHQEKTFTEENGWMLFKGKANDSEPVVATLGVAGNPSYDISTGKGFLGGPRLNFFLENKEIQVTGDALAITNATVTGGQANKDWQTIRPRLSKLEQESWAAVRKAHLTSDSATARQSKEMNTANEKLELEIRKDFIKANPGSVVSLYFLNQMKEYLELDELKSIFGKLSQVHKSMQWYKIIDEKLRNTELTANGKMAVNFSRKDISGNYVSLKALKGKYVLLDFWGSWCMPCRMSHPHLKSLYDKYRQHGLEIVGIANEGGKTLEESMKTWKNAVDADGIPWLQILNDDGKEQFDLVKTYGVTAYPTKILLDREGKIMTRFVGFGGTELDAKLKELFDNDHN